MPGAQSLDLVTSHKFQCILGSEKLNFDASIFKISGEEIDHVQLAKKWANHKDYCKRKAKKISSDLGISYEPNNDGDSFNKSRISYESEVDCENLKKPNEYENSNLLESQINSRYVNLSQIYRNKHRYVYVQLS